jgi:hypothetical protein
MAEQSESHAHDKFGKKCKLGRCNTAWLSEAKAMHMICLRIDVN